MGLGAIDDGWPAPHEYGHVYGCDQFLSGGPGLQGASNMGCNAAVAS